MNKSIIKKFKKNNKTYYLLQCNECKHIQETYHKEYINRKCKKCISQKILGNKYNGSIVYEELVTNNKYQPISYNVKCHCGNNFTVRRDTLRNNINKNKKIQCNKCIKNDISLSRRDIVKNNQLIGIFNRYKYNAEKRNYTFNISFNEFKNIVEKECFYCGIQKSKYSTKTVNYIEINGIDRLDNNLGYELHNCVPCCSMCNKMKQTFNKEDFLNQIFKIYNKHKIFK